MSAARKALRRQGGGTPAQHTLAKLGEALTTLQSAGMHNLPQAIDTMNQEFVKLSALLRTQATDHAKLEQRVHHLEIVLQKAGLLEAT